MGKEERLALRRGVKIEDLIIGSFVFLALLYPLIVFLMIEHGEVERGQEDLELLRTTYLFITGLEDCSPQTASLIASHMDKELLRNMRGIAGLVKLCRENGNRLRGSVSIDEEVRRKEGYLTLTVKLVIREKGIPRRRFKIVLLGKRIGGSFKILEIKHAEGS